MKNPFKAAAEKIKTSRLSKKLRQPRAQRNILAGAGDGFLLGTLGLLIAVAGAPLTAPVIIAAGALFTLGLGAKIASGHIDVPPEQAAPQNKAAPAPAGAVSALAHKAIKPDFAATAEPAPTAPKAQPAARPEAPKP